MRDAGTVRTALGDLDQRLVATAALAEERTLTLTEGYLLSRIDGATSARQVLQLVPLDPDETERTLLGLVLTGRVEYRAAPAPRLVPSPEAEAPPPVDDPAEPVAEPAEASGGTRARHPARGASPRSSPSRPRSSRRRRTPTRALATAELDPETLERRKEILEIFQSLPVKNHFEVLGVEPGLQRRRGEARLHDARQALPPGRPPRPAHRGPARHPRGDLHPRRRGVGGARRREEPRLLRGPLRRRAPAAERRHSRAAEPARRRPQPPEPEPYVTPEETLLKAQLLLSQARYWDAIQVLEATVPQMEPRRHQHRGRILLARAYAKNPNWVRRAEETLQNVVREDPVNVDAHYELGLLYKAGGLAARAQAMFRRVLELRPDHREAAAELGPGEGPGRRPAQAPLRPGQGLLRARTAVRAALLALAAATAVLALGAPRFTWENAGLTVQHPPHQGARALLGAAALAAVALSGTRRARSGRWRSPPRPPWPPSAPSGSRGGSKRSRRACTRGPSPAGRESPGAMSSSSSPGRTPSTSARATAPRSPSPPGASPRRTARASSAPSPVASRTRAAGEQYRQRAASAAGFTPRSERGVRGVRRSTPLR